MRVLIVDADAAELARARQAVEIFGYRCRTAECAADAWDVVARESPELVIVAGTLPGDDAIDLCRRVRTRPAAEPAYLVVLASRATPDLLVRAIEAGIDDLLASPLDEQELHLRLQVAERMTLNQRQVTAARSEVDRLKAALRASSRTDELTGLGNRVQLQDDLALFQGQLERYGHRYAAVLLDLDAFGAFNEQYGRLAGDEALRIVAETIGTRLRTGDRAYRYGGDDFLILLPRQTPDSARVAVERVREALESLAFPHAANPPWGVITASAGIAAFDHEQRGAYRELLAAAEAALAEARANGRNGVGSVLIGTSGS